MMPQGRISDKLPFIYYTAKPTIQHGEMNMKKITTLLATLIVTAMLSSTTLATTLKCTVDSVEGDVVTMNCGTKAANLKAGTMVKVKVAPKKAAAIEGC